MTGNTKGEELLSLLAQVLLGTDSHHEGARCSAAHRVASEYPRGEVRVHFFHGFTCTSRATSPDRYRANNKGKRPPANPFDSDSHRQWQYSDRRICVGDSRSQLSSRNPWRFAVYLLHRRSLALVSGRSPCCPYSRQVGQTLELRQIKRSAGNRNNHLLLFERHIRCCLHVVPSRRLDHAHSLESRSAGVVRRSVTQTAPTPGITPWCGGLFFVCV